MFDGNRDQPVLVEAISENDGASLHTFNLLKTYLDDKVSVLQSQYDLCMNQDLTFAGNKHQVFTDLKDHISQNTEQKEEVMVNLRRDLRDLKLKFDKQLVEQQTAMGSLHAHQLQKMELRLLEETNKLKKEIRERDNVIVDLNRENQNLQKYKHLSDSKLVEEIKSMSQILEEFDNKYTVLEEQYTTKSRECKKLMVAFDKACEM